MRVAPPAPKRILMTADTVGGVWTYAMELCRALGSHGFEVGLATMGAPLRRSQRAEAGLLWNVKVFESDYKLEWMNDPWDDVENAGEWLLQLEDQFQPDIIHLNSFSHGALPWRVPKIVVGHSCVLSWWRATKDADAPQEWNEYRMRVLEGLLLADLVIAPSKAMLTALGQYYGPLPASKVIPNGRRISRDRHDSKENFVLGAGRLWDEAKNMAALVQCAPNISWPVYLAGENCHPHGHATQHSEIHPLGQLAAQELQGWFERAAIFAAPAKYEPFGLSILEAALADCAMVLGDIPSLRENWDGAALFVPPNDLNALESALKELIASRGLRRELSAKAHDIAQRLTPERMAEGYIVTYSEVLAKFYSVTNGTGVLPLVEKEQRQAALWKGTSCES